MSVAPVFKGVVHGGSQRALTLVAGALAEAGHRVRIACSERAENSGGFELLDGVTVEPVLRLRGFFPDPYEAPPHQIADTARDLKPLVEWADRIYLHADIFHFRSLVPPGVPLIRSFHDFHYETALVSAFAYGADLTIVPSEYLRRCIRATVGESGLRALEPVEVIPNGIDLGVYRPGGTRAAPAGVAPRRPGELVLLHPHRPDPRKGIEQSLRVVLALRRQQPRRPVRLLVPRHVDAPSDPGIAAHYADVERLAHEIGVADSVEFHPWFGEPDMPALYRFADATLCLGNFIESFGLTVYESLACGSTVVAARVGALREAPEFADLYRVEFGDVAGATEAVAEAGRGMRDAEGARQLIGDRFGMDAMTKAYVAAIQDAVSRPQRDAAPVVPSSYGLAPWCHVAGNRIYNDYAYRHLELPGLASVVVLRASGWDLSTLAKEGVPEAEVQEAVRAGVLIRSDSSLV
ncbi:MAG: glycosyltransferase family 4 protein [Chloroflexi bacterium]|nr:glycosyltransferase family 4 protein [Chloroflexota bacterium]